MTLGSDRPFIVVRTGLVDLLDDEERRVVSGMSSATCCPATPCTGRCSTA